MIYIDNEPLNKNKYLFSFFKNVDIVYLPIKGSEGKTIEDSIDNDVLLFNPNIELLEHLLRYTIKNFYIALSSVKYEYLKYLNNVKIKEVYVVDNLDSIFLKQNSINHKLVIPSEIKIIQDKKIDAILCLTNLKHLTYKETETMKKLAKVKCLIYEGLKPTYCKADFIKLTELTYSDTLVQSYPLFNIAGEISKYKYVLCHKVNESFPIEAYVALKVGSVPLLRVIDRYYKWLPGFLHFAKIEHILDLFKNMTEERIIEKMIESC